MGGHPVTGRKDVPFPWYPGLTHYVVLGAILFAISVIGIFLNRRNVIIMLMALLAGTGGEHMTG